MSEPIQEYFTIPDPSTPDLKMMSIWAQALGRHQHELTSGELKASAEWFKAFLDAKVSEVENIKKL